MPVAPGAVDTEEQKQERSAELREELDERATKAEEKRDEIREAFADERTIAFAQCTFDRDVGRTIECVERVHGAVDYCIIVVDQTVDDDQYEAIKRLAENVVMVRTEFDDNLPEFRNTYVEKAKALDVDWLCVSDPDELYSESLARDLRSIIEDAEEEGADMLGVNCHNKFEAVEWLDDLDQLKETPGGYEESNYFKNLIFKLYPSLEYEGVGESGTVHETWSHDEGEWSAAHLAEEYFYTHEKSALDIFRNAARNFWMGGGGDNVGEMNPEWVPFRELCREQAGVESWPEFEEYMQAGDVADEISDTLIEYLQVPPTDYGREMREMSKWYFAMHPGEITDEVQERIDNPPERTKEMEVEDQVRQIYFQLLGRHPDRDGLEYYKRRVLEGELTLQDVQELIMQSDEYREKRGGTNVDITDRVTPVMNVTMDLTEEMLVDIMTDLDVHGQWIERRLDLARAIEEQADDVDELYDEFYRRRELGTLDIRILPFLEGDEP